MSASMQQLAQIRNQIADIQAQIREIESASLTKQDVETRIRAFIQTLQSRFDADFIGRALVSADGALTTTDVLNACYYDESNGSDRPLVLLAWMNPDLLEQKLTRAAEPYLSTGKSAIPTDKRPAMLKKLDDQLAELLHQEEAAIVELEQAGHQVFRRANIDPLVILAAD